jgi:hypothetical protein
VGLTPRLETLHAGVTGARWLTGSSSNFHKDILSQEFWEWKILLL